VTRKVMSGTAEPVVLFVMRDDGDCEPFQFVQQDPTTVILPSPAQEHKDYFIASYVKDGVRKDAPIDVMLISGTRQERLGWAISCGGDMEVVFCEIVRLNSSGRRLDVFCTNLSSDVVSGAEAFHTPVLRELADPIFSEYAPGGEGNSSIGVVSTFVEMRWTLKPSTMYLIRGINRSERTKRMSAMLIWEERESDA
jgi:hypothetical protein